MEFHLQNLLSSLLFLITLFIFAPTWADKQYAVVFDAGSSGTRIHTFATKQLQTTEAGGMLPVIEEIQSAKVKKGVATYIDNPTALPNMLKSLLDSSKEIGWTTGAAVHIFFGE